MKETTRLVSHKSKSGFHGLGWTVISPWLLESLPPAAEIEVKTSVFRPVFFAQKAEAVVGQAEQPGRLFLVVPGPLQRLFE